MRFKDSGIEWLGEIPEHWEVRKLKYIGEIFGGVTGKTIKDFSKEYKPNFKPYITFTNVCNNAIINPNLMEYVFIDSKEKQNKVLKNDILFLQSSETFEYVGKSAIYLNDDEVYLNTFCRGFRIERAAYPNYLNYLLSSLSYKRYFMSVCSGFTRINLRQEHFLDIPLILPPLQEQKAIAEFLDKKCDKISQFIESKQKLITLLQEKKQALINAVVCRGLNKNTELKESGVKYLGTIPKHWEVRKLKSLFSLGNGLNITKENFVSCGIPCVNYGEIHSKYPCRLDIAIHKLPLVSKEYLRIKPQSLLQKGDFVFADTSEDIEGSGNFTSIQSSESIFAGYHTIILKPKSEINSLYFSFLFDSLGIRHQIRKEVCGVKVYSITKAILKEVQLIIPPLQEQKAIASYLDTQITKIDLAIEKTKQQIALIKEYKTSLINQAICGRIQQKD